MKNSTQLEKQERMYLTRVNVIYVVVTQFASAGSSATGNKKCFEETKVS